MQIMYQIVQSLHNLIHNLGFLICPNTEITAVTFDTAPHWNTQLLLSTFIPDQPIKQSQFPLVNQANDKMQGLHIIHQLSKQLFPKREIQAEMSYGERRSVNSVQTLLLGITFPGFRENQDSTDRLQQSSSHIVQHLQAHAEESHTNPSCFLVHLIFAW